MVSQIHALESCQQCQLVHGRASIMTEVFRLEMILMFLGMRIHFKKKENKTNPEQLADWAERSFLLQLCAHQVRMVLREQFWVRVLRCWSACTHQKRRTVSLRNERQMHFVFLIGKEDFLGHC